MIRIKNEIFKGSDGRESLMDITIPEKFNGKICFFVHGYKGYKDWGAWNLIENKFTLNGFGFIKFNLSHNGGTVSEPIDFPDLEAFSVNTYSKELFDIGEAIEKFESLYPKIWNESKKYLIGHSRGGGDTVLFGARHQDLLDGIITWAAIADIEERFPVGDALNEWMENGVYYVRNARTNQEMPHLYAFYEDYLKNKESLNIEKAARSIQIPWLIVHGANDEAVALDNAERLHLWSNAEFKIIQETGHTFDTKHPMTQNYLSDKTKELVDLTLQFLEQH